LLPPRQINGKSANLNNCLKNIIYRELAGRPNEIPKEEVLVVFDADMCAKKHFFCKVTGAVRFFGGGPCGERGFWTDMRRWHVCARVLCKRMGADGCGDASA
jgi:hypothetical protein